jgi:glycosyltransferase involved in cell wall biosynthesis
MCLHDNTLAAALLDAGEDVLLIPTYTPIRTDEPDVSLPRVFFGGINVYLQYASGWFRHVPRFLRAVLDRPSILRLATRRAASVDPARLGGLTVAMLEGSEGTLRGELARLVDWLTTEARPDVVHLSNAMLLATTGEICRRVPAPVVCSLSGEDVFLERVPEPHYTRARELMRRNARHVAAFVAMNRYYADFMIDYIDLDPQRVHVVRHGLNLNGHSLRRTKPQRSGSGDPVTIGYFARICHDKGLHQLVEAFKLLCEDSQLPPLRLEAAGYLAGPEKAYLAEQEARLRAWGLADRFCYRGELDRPGKIAFLQSLDLMCVPTVYRESKGLSVLEAMANGVPLVLPAHGGFPELIEDTGGGLLFEPGNIGALAAAIKQYVQQPQLADEHGRRGAEAIGDRYHAARMAEETLGLYRRVCGDRAGTASSENQAPEVASPESSPYV